MGIVVVTADEPLRRPIPGGEVMVAYSGGGESGFCAFELLAKLVEEEGRKERGGGTARDFPLLSWGGRGSSTSTLCTIG